MQRGARAPAAAAAVALAGAVTAYGLTGQVYAQGRSDKLSVYDEETPSPVDHETHPTRLQNAVSDTREKATNAAQEAAKRGREFIDATIRAEEKVEATVRKVQQPEEPLMPNLLYIGIIGLAGTIAARQRSIAARLLLPPLFVFGSAFYFMPNTMRASLGLVRETVDSPEVRDSVRKHAPSVLDTTDAARDSVARGVEQAASVRRNVEDSVSDSVARARHEYHSLEGKVRDALGSGSNAVSERVHELGDKSHQLYEEAAAEARARADSVSGWLQGRKEEANDVLPPAREVRETVSETANKGADKTTDLGDQIKHQIDETRRRADDLVKETSERAEDAADWVRVQVDGARTNVQEAVDQSRERVQEAVEQGRARVQRAKESVERSLRSENNRRPS
ncbi:apolipo protein O-domain-containing protein [Thamnocephalis sphaerospora]|uniref:MICOS complex subunit n=1 Tax=Thamnocephalis sphaerospora TaxID=78915 RepID=A0A4P9XHQ7_9FUNG|nr:apolipo protein O-domain-containing protein [Thamnocephalis sphaerospora]|eukprot:RKP04750.1 apolipo protein O-domain-containing protein [Thamnocephalis sphaerospora]